MEDTYHLNTIVLNREDWRENDSRVIVFSREKGRIELIARGTKKIKSKLAAHLEPFSLTEIMAIRGRHFDYVGTAMSDQCFFNLKNNLNKINLAAKGIKAFREMITGKEEVGAGELYFLLRKYLEAVNSLKNSKGFFYHIFILKLISLLGYYPNLNRCSECDREIVKNSISFSHSSGGVVCSDCAKNINDSQKISDKSRQNLVSFLKQPFDELISSRFETNNELPNLIENYFQYISESKI